MNITEKRLKIVAKLQKKEYNNMSKLEKALKRLQSKPKDFTYEELKMILNNLGFIQNNKGKTSGSKIEFENRKIEMKICLHRPHPSNIIKPYIINNVLDKLRKGGML